LLRVVELLHSTSAVHRDIALHSVGEKDVRADAFTRHFAPAAIQKGKTRSWRLADDVYQIGCMYAVLLCG
jgi:hypothetical protein